MDKLFWRLSELAETGFPVKVITGVEGHMNNLMLKLYLQVKVKYYAISKKIQKVNKMWKNVISQKIQIKKL